MKKKTWLIPAAALAACVPLALTACDQENVTPPPTKYTITYYDGATKLLEQTVDPNGKAYNWAPAKSGYEFAQWCTTASVDVAYDFTTGITGNISLYAKYTPVTPPAPATEYVSVKYCDGDDVILEQKVEKGSTATNWKPAKEGKVFTAWVTAKGGETAYDFTAKVNADVSIYATFVDEEVPPVVYTVKYYDGDTELLAQAVDPEAKAYNWTPVKEGKVFTGWVTAKGGETAFDFENGITADTNLYATFEDEVVPPTVYTVTYYAADGETVLLQQVVGENETALNWTPAAEFGYTFGGWVGSDNKAYTFGEVTSDIDLKAKFNAVSQKPIFKGYKIAHLNDGGTSFTYQYGDKAAEVIDIEENVYYLDGRLSDSEIAGYKNVYNDFNTCFEALPSGTEEKPTKLYIAPYVYWIHNPDSNFMGNSGKDADTLIRKTCHNLQMIGLSEKAEDVVIAANYGHDEGYIGGNPTGFNFTGNNFTMKNITFGNYCNVDLVYPLNPNLSRAKRSGNVTQGQLASYSGDKFFAENCQFISRLNMMPFLGGTRVLYKDCHLESTDDSLNGGGQVVYLNCDFEHWASKPWGGVSGVTLLGCNMKVTPYVPSTQPTQYVSKMAGVATLIDCQYWTDEAITEKINLTFSETLSNTFRAYYSNVTTKLANGTVTQENMGGKDNKYADRGVDITGTPLLDSFKFTAGGKTYYNIYGLLGGSDGWDPLNQKALIEANANKEALLNFNISMSASLASGKASLTAYADEATATDEEKAAATAVIKLALGTKRGQGYADEGTITWSLVDPTMAKYVQLTPSADGKTCTVVNINRYNELPTVVVEAKSSTGLRAAYAFTCNPSKIAAPAFATAPAIAVDVAGATVNVTYAYDATADGLDDNAEVIWYITNDAAVALNDKGAVTVAEGKELIQVATSREGEPFKNLALNKAYVGYSVVATVRAKHLRCDYGTKVLVKTAALTAADVANVSDTLIVLDVLHAYDGYNGTIKAGTWVNDMHKVGPSGTKVKDDDQLAANLVRYEGAAEAGKMAVGINKDEAGWDWGHGDEPKANTAGLVYSAPTSDGFAGYKGFRVNTARFARLGYRTLNTTTGDMGVIVKVATGKSAAQGFGSNGQFVDFMIKYDLENNVGYGVRIFRNTGSSCAFALIQHSYNETTQKAETKILSNATVTTVFSTEMTLSIWTETVGGKTTLKVTATSDNESLESKTTKAQDAQKPELNIKVESSVTLSAEIAMTTNGDFMMWHHGTVGANSIVLTSVEVHYAA